MAEAMYARIFGNQDADNSAGFSRINTSPVDRPLSMPCTLDTFAPYVLLPPSCLFAIIYLS